MGAEHGARNGIIQGGSMTQEQSKRCAALKKNGEPCTVDEDLLMQTADGTWFCFSHHPEYEQARALARTRGGIDASRRPANQPRYLTTADLGDLETPADALRWSQVIGGSVVTGKLSANVAGVALKALESWHRAHELIVLEERLTELERRISTMKGAA